MAKRCVSSVRPPWDFCADVCRLLTRTLDGCAMIQASIILLRAYCSLFNGPFHKPNGYRRTLPKSHDHRRCQTRNSRRSFAQRSLLLGPETEVQHFPFPICCQSNSHSTQRLCPSWPRHRSYNYTALDPDDNDGVV